MAERKDETDKAAHGVSVEVKPGAGERGAYQKTVMLQRRGGQQPIRQFEAG